MVKFESGANFGLFLGLKMPHRDRLKKKDRLSPIIFFAKSKCEMFRT